MDDFSLCADALTPMENSSTLFPTELSTSPARTPALANGLPFSTSDSLVKGLVSRLVPEWADNDRAYWSKRRAEAGPRGISMLTLKRAHAYRVLRERSLALIPDGHQLLVGAHGNQNGLDKHAGFAVVHWAITNEPRRMEVVMTYGRPVWRLPSRCALFTVADHALQRMFFRLRTLNDQDVLAELANATRTICAWYPFLNVHIDERMAIGVRTPSGMLVLRRVPTAAPFSPCEFLATTWVSDDLIEVRNAQAVALKQARVQECLVIQVDDEYFSLSLAHNFDRFTVSSQTYTNVFYTKMIRHLPLAEPLTHIL